MNEYMKEAISHLGLKEIPGAENNDLIVSWWVKMGSWLRLDSSPWCGLFTAICLKNTGHPVPKQFYRALKWLDYGLPCSIGVGAIAVMKRQGGGHVAFVAGRTKEGKIVLLGGNQGDKVCYTSVLVKDILAYRRPINSILDYKLPLIDVVTENASFA